MGKILDIYNLSDKVAIITGGIGLLGVKHAEAIAEMGGLPILFDIDEKSSQVQAKYINREIEGILLFCYTIIEYIHLNYILVISITFFKNFKV